MTTTAPPAPTGMERTPRALQVRWVAVPAADGRVPHQMVWALSPAPASVGEGGVTLTASPRSAESTARPAPRALTTATA